MLGWSNPFNTSISDHTLSSFPLTFFFGITFSATSLDIPLGRLSPPSPGDVGFDTGLSDDALVGMLLLVVLRLLATDRLDFLLGVLCPPSASSSSATAPRSAVAIWSTGTCQVAFCHIHPVRPESYRPRPNQATAPISSRTRMEEKQDHARNESD